MIYGLIQRVVALLAYRELGGVLYRGHAGLKMLALALAWAGLLAVDTVPGVAAAICYPLLLHVLAPGWLRGHAFRASMIPTLFIMAAALLLSPYPPFTMEWGARAVVLSVRTYGLASATLLSFATTSPMRLASLVYRSATLHDLLTLFYRVTPLTLGDLAEALAAQRLLGKPVYHTLVPLVLSSMRRAEGVAVSLQARGYGGGREPIVGPGDVVAGLLLSVASALVLAASLVLDAGLV